MLELVSDPEMQEMLNDIKTNGMGALARYSAHPKMGQLMALAAKGLLGGRKP